MRLPLVVLPEIQLPEVDLPEIQLPAGNESEEPESSISISGTPSAGGTLYASLVSPRMLALVHEGFALLHDGEALVYPDLQWYIDGVALAGAEGRYFTVPRWIAPEAEITVGNSTGLLSDPVFVPALDADASNYIGRVETADNAALEMEVKWAMNRWFTAQKAAVAPTSASNWAALPGGTGLLTGARTLAGFLTPVHPDMPAPTNVNFVQGDYERLRGLKGNAINKYLNTNVANNAQPQNDASAAVWISELPVTTVPNRMIMSQTNLNGAAGRAISPVSYMCNSGAANASVNISGRFQTGFYGISRDNALYSSCRLGGETTVDDKPSNTVSGSASIHAFKQGNNSAELVYSDVRLAFIGLGTSVDLAAMDTSLAAYMNDLSQLILS